MSATVAVARRQHGVAPRGLDSTPSSSSYQGPFGRLFRQLPAANHDAASLRILAAAIIAAASGDNPDIPAGYTYLGQFIDHDITFDPTPFHGKLNDPDALHNFRTPRYDLDSVYGRGPADQPYLYRHDRDPVPHPTRPGIDLRGIAFRLGEPVSADPRFAGPDLPRDLPRQRLEDGQPVDVFEGRALIGDPRNDENLIVSQLHLTMLKFHNRMVERVAARSILSDEELQPRLFEDAQRQVRWHYQWVVIDDFLRRVAGGDVVDDVLRSETFRVHGGEVTIREPNLRFYHPRKRPFMPLEFSAAAYRFGHSLVRARYRINEIVPVIPIFSDDPSEFANLNGFRRLPAEWGFQWKFFFTDLLDPGDTPDIVQASRLVDAAVEAPLGMLPGEKPPRSLPERNLLRGLRVGLPSGQAVARAIGVEPLTNAELELPEGTPDLVDQAPLWYYVLKEAEVTASGLRLGPVGGRIVAEVFVGLLAGDRLSFLNVEPSWTPDPELSGPDGTFKMHNLLAFATATGPAG
jgi:Animal haem peroxidase